MPVAATIGSAALGGGASLLGASQAAKASRRATEATLQLQREQYERNQALQQPYVDAGYEALGGLRSDLLSPSAWSYGPQDYVESPGFNFLLDRALDQVQARGAAGGYSLSGPMLQRLADTTRGLLSQDYYQQQGLSRSNFESDRNYRTGGLMNVANLGQNAASGVGAAGQAYAGAAGNALLSNAAAQGAAAQSAAGGFGGAVNNGLNAYLDHMRRRPA